MKASRLLIAGAVAALLPVAGVFAQTATPDRADQAPPASQSSKHGSSFDSLDTDRDGRISKSEAAADENVSAQFSKYDLNGDGYIEREEVTKANHPQPETPPKP